jgi:hypothetical protein
MEEKRMSEQNPYETLKVTEDASFEEIQTARDRLIKATNGDEKLRESIEAAYDAILMDRLRRRQEGKIKVPERIRFAERLAETPPKAPLPRGNQSPPWLQRLIDTPSAKEIAIPGALFASLAGFSFYSQSSDTLAFLLALGVGFNLYWLNHKEQKLGRSFLLTLAALAIGGLIGTAILQVALPLGNLSAETFVSLIVFLMFWLVSSFLR